jgi:hypothetical protein
MAISGISSVTTITPQTTTPAQLEAAKSAPSEAAKSGDSDKASSAASSPAPAAQAPTVLTQGASSAHHHKKPHHPAPGQPGYAVNKKA